MSVNDVFGPNDHHLEEDPRTGKMLPQPGLGAEAAEEITRRRPASRGEMEGERQRAVRAEADLDAAKAEIEKLQRQLAASGPNGGAPDNPPAVTLNTGSDGTGKTTRRP